VTLTALPGCGGVTIQPGQLAASLAGVPYNQPFTLAGGMLPATFVLNGDLPAGLTFANGVISGATSATGAYPITVSATDAAACDVSASFTLAVSAERRLVAGAGSGGSAVRAFRLGSTRAVSALDVVSPDFIGGVSVAQGDTDGDGIPEIIGGAAPGGGPAVRVFDGRNNALIASFYAFDPSFRGGVEVAAGDITGDGLAEVLVASPSCGAPFVVRAFNAQTGALLREYPVSAPWSCGLHVAAGDVNGDGIADVVAGSGYLGSLVTVIDGFSSATIRQFSAYFEGFGGGVYVGAGDLTGDGFADIVTGAGAGGGPHVRAFDGVTGAEIPGPLGSFFAYHAAFPGGVRVAAGDLNGDGRAELITAAGPGGGPHVRVFDGASGSELLGLFAFDPAFPGGAFVAAPPATGRMAIDVPTGTSGTSVRVAGWALKQLGVDTVGTDAIHVWALPAGGGAPLFVGSATSRVARPDVASVFGGEFLMSGYDITGTLAPGTYDLAVFARNSRTRLFDQLRLVRITVN
jgi:hypothetical protein